MKETRWRARTRQELILEVWDALESESVGAGELETIQREIETIFGVAAVESPAAIARTLADEGAVLRHPEVLKCDKAWRESQISKLDVLKLSTLDEAIESMHLLRERWREQVDLERERLRQVVLEAKKQAQLRAKSQVVDAHERLLAREVAEWLTVWLTDPSLFADWLTLRQRSPEFLERFPNKATSE